MTICPTSVHGTSGRPVLSVTPPRPFSLPRFVGPAPSRRPTPEGRGRHLAYDSLVPEPSESMTETTGTPAGEPPVGAPRVGDTRVSDTRVSDTRVSDTG